MLNNQIVFGLACFVLGGIISPIVSIGQDAIMTWYYKRRHAEIEKGFEEFYENHIKPPYDVSSKRFKEQKAGQNTGSAPITDGRITYAGDGGGLGHYGGNKEDSSIPEEYQAESDHQPEEEDEEEKKKREGERGFFS